jgi:hypothetical protein
MAADKFPKSGLPIRRSVELLPVIFQTPTNDKFLSAVVDPLIQPGVLYLPEECVLVALVV